MNKNEKKRGFTLIELLAIIVILAIIAVITVPLILEIIDESKQKASVDSAYGFKDAIEKDYATKLLNNNEQKLNGTYTILNGKLGSIELPISGIKPSNGTLTYQNNKLVSGCLTIDGYKVQYQDNEFTATKGDCNAELVCPEGEHLEVFNYEPNNDISNACTTYFSAYNFLSREEASAYCNGETVDGYLSFQWDIEEGCLSNEDIEYLMNIGLVNQNGTSYTLNNTLQSNNCQIGIMGFLSYSFLTREQANSYCNGETITTPDEPKVSLARHMNDLSILHVFNQAGMIKEGTTIGCVSDAYMYYDKEIKEQTEISSLPEDSTVYILKNGKVSLCGIEGGQTICLSNDFINDIDTINSMFNCGLTSETIQGDFTCEGNNININKRTYSSDSIYLSFTKPFDVSCHLEMDENLNIISKECKDESK